MVSNMFVRDSEAKTELEKERERQEEYLLDGLSVYIRECFERAREHRASHGIDARIARNLRNYKAVYSDCDKAKFEGIETFRGLTGMLCRVAVGWIEDSYSYVDNRPWRLEPTPIPRLPLMIQTALAEAVDIRSAELQQALAMSRITFEQRTDVIRALRQEANRLARKEAERALEAMSMEIEDQLTEGGWRKAFREFIMDIAISPTAIIKGPVVKLQRRAHWDGDELVEEEVAQLCWENIRANDAYPSPDSTDCQDGEYFIDRMRVTRSQLVAAKKLTTFSEAAIDLVLEENANGVTESDDDGNTAQLEVFDHDNPSLYLVYDFYGRVSGDKILEWLHAENTANKAKDRRSQVETEFGDIDPFDTYEINAWLCGGKVIRALLNPTPLGHRPIQATSYAKVPGSFWGDSVADLLASLQEELNAAARSRVFNMGIASGPLVEMDSGRIPENKRPDSIVPWTIYFTDSASGMNTSTPAIRFYQANSNAGELTSVMEEVWMKGHDIAGLPPYTRGVNDGAARTLGAFTMQYNAAAKGIKMVMGNIDADVIEPGMEKQYYYNMFYNEDNTIKADASVVARGSMGLIRKEQQQARPLETLQTLGPFLQSKPEMADRLVSDYLIARGYAPEDIGLTPGSLERAVTGSVGAVSDPTAIAGPGMPPLDGRSGQAVSSMNQASPVAPGGGRVRSV